MKKILLPGILLCAVFGIKAQTTKILVTDSAQFMQQQLLLPNRVMGKTNKGTIYALPQDGMPCLVPDSSAWAQMPNAKTGDAQSGVMPNPYKPNSLRNTLLKSESSMQLAIPNPYKPQSFPKIITLPPVKATPKKKDN